MPGQTNPCGKWFAAHKSVAPGLLAVCLGPGGIPKHEVGAADVSLDGLAGDRQRASDHGGRDRAVCLFSSEDYASLARDNVAAAAPGSYGENLTISGLPFAELRAGDRLRLGDDLELEIADIREPCATLKPVDRRFPDLLVGRSGFVCRVLHTGSVRPGMRVERF